MTEDCDFFSSRSIQVVAFMLTTIELGEKYDSNVVELLQKRAEDLIRTQYDSSDLHIF